MFRLIFLYHTPKKSVSIIEGGEIEEPLKKKCVNMTKIVNFGKLNKLLLEEIASKKISNYSAYHNQQLSSHSSKFHIGTLLNLSFGYEVDRYWFLFGMGR